MRYGNTSTMRPSLQKELYKRMQKVTAYADTQDRDCDLCKAYDTFDLAIVRCFMDNGENTSLNWEMIRKFIGMDNLYVKATGEKKYVVDKSDPDRFVKAAIFYYFAKLA